MVNILRRSAKTGLPPGSLVYIGEERDEPVNMALYRYNKDVFSKEEMIDFDETLFPENNNEVKWLNIEGLHNIPLFKKIGDFFKLHDLTMEDILNTEQRPKLEIIDDYVYVVLKMLVYDKKQSAIDSEQVSIILSGSTVITFQERKGDVFDPLRERIRTNGTRVRKSGADFLTYALVDLIVDNYFIILEQMGDDVDELEDKVFSNPNLEVMQQLFTLKRNIVLLRKSVWPLREVVNAMDRNEETVFKKGTQVYLRDLYDHIIQVLDGIESTRDIVTGLVEIYLTTINNNMSSIMKVLTIISTIFIPLTFIAGVYGMNFLFMPELQWRWSYPVVLGVMLLIGVGMMIFFRKKKWL